MVTSWNPPHLNWFKWNTGHLELRLKKSTTISFLCRDDKGKFHHSICITSGDVSVPVTEAILLVKLSRRKAIQLKMNN